MTQSRGGANLRTANRGANPGFVRTARAAFIRLRRKLRRAFGIRIAAALLHDLEGTAAFLPVYSEQGRAPRRGDVRFGST